MLLVILFTNKRKRLEIKLFQEKKLKNIKILSKKLFQIEIWEQQEHHYKFEILTSIQRTMEYIDSTIIKAIRDIRDKCHQRPDDESIYYYLNSFIGIFGRGPKWMVTEYGKLDARYWPTRDPCVMMVSGVEFLIMGPLCILW